MYVHKLWPSTTSSTYLHTHILIIPILIAYTILINLMKRVGQPGHEAAVPQFFFFSLVFRQALYSHVWGIE